MEVLSPSIITETEGNVNMDNDVFVTTVTAMAKTIQMLEFRLEQAEKENRDLHDQLSDLFIKIHIGKENEQ